MFIPIDIDNGFEKQKETEINTRSIPIVQQVSEDFKTQYLDTIKDKDGNSIELEDASCENCVRMNGLSSSEKKELDELLNKQEINEIDQAIRIASESSFFYDYIASEEVQRYFSNPDFQKHLLLTMISKKHYGPVLSTIPYIDFPGKMEIFSKACAEIEVNIGGALDSFESLYKNKKITLEEHEKLKNILLSKKGDFRSLLAQSEDNTFSLFQAHPAYNFAVQYKSHIENVLQTNTDIAQYYDLDKKRQREEIIFLIAENLFHKGITQNIDDTIIEECIQDFLQFRHKYEDMTLFEDRNVLLIASNEERLEEDERGEDQHTGEFRFGQEKTIKMMKKQADDFDILRPADLSMKTAKEELKQKIINAPKNTTFVFAGHGGTWKNGSISFGEYKESKKIDWFIFDTDEMVDAFVERYQKHNNISKDNPDIIIFSSCYNNNIYHRFIEILKQKMPNAPLPIGVLPAEFGQVLIDTDTQYDHDIFLNLEKKYGEKHDIKLKDIFDIEFDPHTPDNPSIYIPHQGNIQKIAVNLDKSPNLES